MNKTIIGIIIIIVGLFIWSKMLESNNPDIVSRNGLHWHPALFIYIRGEKQEIPANLGLGAVHQPIHTHEDASQGILHLEFEGVVRKKHIMLGEFFESWGKDIRSFGTNLTMTVNGVENTDYENYIMKDQDRIELHYQ